MAGKESVKSATEDAPAAAKSFYGLAGHPNNTVFSSFLKRKGRKLAMTDDCKTACKQVEMYKTSADRLHQALLFYMVEYPEYAKTLAQVIRVDPCYEYAATTLKTYDHVQKKGRKPDALTYPSLEKAIRACADMDKEHKKRVRTMLEVLKPLTRFIGDEYWEYARLRKVYWLSIEAFDDAVTLQNKERTEQSERATSMAQTYRNDCRLKMMEFITRSIVDQKEKHAACVLKFREEIALYHKAMGDLINDPESKSALQTAIQ